MPAPRPIDRSSGHERPVSIVAVTLAIGWLVVPAVQYYATSERTRYQIGEAEAWATPTAMVEWDLTYVYLLLVVATVLFAARRYFAGKAELSATTAENPEPGGSA
jgi:hypothetical protein